MLASFPEYRTECIAFDRVLNVKLFEADYLEYLVERAVTVLEQAVIEDILVQKVECFSDDSHNDGVVDAEDSEELEDSADEHRVDAAKTFYRKQRTPCTKLYSQGESDGHTSIQSRSDGLPSTNPKEASRMDQIAASCNDSNYKTTVSSIYLCIYHIKTINDVICF